MVGPEGASGVRGCDTMLHACGTAGAGVAAVDAPLARDHRGAAVRTCMHASEVALGRRESVQICA